MALEANALTTLATVKEELGISTTQWDAQLERRINVASDAIQTYLGRPLERATVTSERVKGYGDQRILLLRTPVVSITSIIYGGATIDAAGYYIENADAGIVFRSSGWEWTAIERTDSILQEKQPGTEEGLLLVTYVGGWQTPAQGGTRTLPFDIEQACVDTVVQGWRNKGKYQNLQNETELQADASWRGEMIPGPALRQLRRYRRLFL